MTVVIKPKGELVVPRSVRRKAGIKTGDRVEFKVSGGVISIVPSGDDEYTPAQRRIIDARLDESEEDLKKGRTAGPFKNANEMIDHLRKQIKQRGTAKLSKRSG